MLIYSNYKLREIADATIIIKQGTRDINLTPIISLNNSAKFLYEKFSDKEFTTEDVVNVLKDTFHISYKRAKKDAKIWIESMKKYQIIE